MVYLGLQPALGKLIHRFTCSVGSPHANEATNAKMEMSSHADSWRGVMEYEVAIGG